MTATPPAGTPLPRRTAAIVAASAADASDRQALANLERLRAEVRDPTSRGFHRFCELVLVDEAGRPVRQGAIHLTWESHARWCWAHGLIPVTLAPWGHGKSVQRVAARLAWMLGCDPTLRSLVVTNNDANARGRVNLVRGILESERFKLLFPDVQIETANEFEIKLKRPTSFAADPAVRGKTYGSSGTGVRADVLQVDDVADFHNSVETPAERPKVASTLEGAWQSRLVPRTPGERRAWVGYQEHIGTRWHDEDWWGHVLQTPGYCTLVQAVSEDNSRIDCVVVAVEGPEGHRRPADLSSYPWAHELARVDFDPTALPGDAPAEPPPAVRGYEQGKAIGSVPLWEAGGYTQEKLCQLEATAERWHNCGRRQRPFSEGERLFPHFADCYAPFAPLAKVPDGYLVAVGADLSGARRAGNFIVVLASNGRDTIPLIVDTGKWTSPEMAGRLTEHWNRWQPDVVVVETNGYQAALVDWGRVANAPWVSRVVAFVTGTNKNDADIGVGALDLEFSNRAWRIPELAWQGHELTTCACAWCAWRRSFTTLTATDLRSRQALADPVMATWLARGGFQRIGRGAIEFVGTNPRDDVTIGHLGVTSRAAEDERKAADALPPGERERALLAKQVWSLFPDEVRRDPREGEGSGIDWGGR